MNETLRNQRIAKEDTVNRVPIPDKHLNARILGILLITAVLIALPTGCDDGTTPTEYSLTMLANPGVGGMATDLTGSSPYTAGASVSIKAEAAAGYEFIGWTAPAGTFDDEYATETTFTMPAQDLTVTTNFFQGQLIAD